MKELSDFCREFKKDFSPKINDAKLPVKFWVEKDAINGNIFDTFVLIFRTKGCSWSIQSGCTMCGYFNDSLWTDVRDEDLLNQLDVAIDKYNGEKFVKIFTSGSFFDNNEISNNVRYKILEFFSKKADKISVESRPEYVTHDRLSIVKDIINNNIFEVGIGLETSNDYIREKCINKGFSFNDYKKATKLLKNFNFIIKTYVLVKPPFLTEKESIKDSIQTIEDIKNCTDIISINPVNVQRNTYVEYLWKRRYYRPPWLWSIIDILINGKQIIGNKRIKCDIVGGGKIRGPHNCGICDNSIIDSISTFSINQNINLIKNLKCDCFEKWLDQLDIERFGYGSLIDVYR
jgi:radical SAM enzyme (TIGR01210 family)